MLSRIHELVGFHGVLKRRSHAPHHHRTLPHQKRRAHSPHHPPAARATAPRRELQPFPPARRRCPHRPAHRFRHRSHVHPPVGRHHGRRRKLRRQSQLRSVPRLRAGYFRLQARHPYPSGPSRRAHPVQRDVQKRRCSPQDRKSVV